VKRVYSAKFLTFAYFSVVAFALIAIHVSVYWHTTEDLEQLYGQNRLDKVREQAEQMLAGTDIGERASMRVRPQENTEFDRGTEVVFDYSTLPDWLPAPEQLPWDEGVEAVSRSTGEAYYLMKTRFETGDGIRDAVLLMDFRLYEISEEQLFASHAKQIAISGLLLIVSLFIVIKISARLTDPISQFATSLANKPAENLEPLPLPKGTVTRELAELVDTFNRFEERIRSLLERERSFSRYASHELRTPLTVMRGALTLMEESDDAAFIALQRKRMNDALVEMSELIETLLSLSKSDNGDPHAPRELTRPELDAIAREHEYLLAGKKLSWKTRMHCSPYIMMPEAAFRILLGNLVKNAFRYAQTGEVLIEAFSDRISVSDAGAEHADSEHIQEGYGLGLLLVRDICNRYGWHTDYSGNENGGWTTTIRFQETT
jgi:signal transduction histidine kinase